MVNLPFLKKRQSAVMPGKGSIPTDRVREMASRGFSEPEMIDVLRREGYSPEEIDKALTSALRLNVTGEAGIVQQPVQQQTAPQAVSQDIMPNLTPATQTARPAQQQETVLPQIPETSLPEDYYASYSAEDYIDYALQTRMSEVSGRLEDIEEKQKQLSSRIEELGKKFETTLSRSGVTPSDVSAKVQRFNETISDIDARVGSLEKAFKETLPALIEGVRTLSDLIQKTKKES